MKELLLGRHTPVVESYSPELLYPIARQEARDGLGFTDVLPFYGVDIWHAYEISWLDNHGKPLSRVGRITVPAMSPNLVESKSFKLYLNSLNSWRFKSEADAINCIETDVGAIVGQKIHVQLFSPDDRTLSGHALQGACVDDCSIVLTEGEPNEDLIEVALGETREERLYSHLLRSLCPVTGQPDWATVWIHYRGAAIDHNSLLTYLVAYRQHQEFHEQCVERMFRDIKHRSKAEFLHIQAFYTRRGGLDISPFRSTEADAIFQPRLNRQ